MLLVSDHLPMVFSSLFFCQGDQPLGVNISFLADKLFGNAFVSKVSSYSCAALFHYERSLQ